VSAGGPLVLVVLDGLGIAPTWELELREGSRRLVSPEPVSVGRWISALGGRWWQVARRAPLYLRLSQIPYGLSKIDRGRALSCRTTRRLIRGSCRSVSSASRAASEYAASS
jgi:hypothetical protein